MLDLKAVEYPPFNTLFYWTRNTGVDSYNLYVRPFGSSTWTLVNPTPIPVAKVNYPPMPVDTLPEMVASIDPVYYKWWTLDAVNTSDWVVKEVTGGVEGAVSNIYTHYPKAVIATSLDHQDPKIVQMQRWDPDTQRFVNWDAKVDVIAAEDVHLLNKADVTVNPATEEKQDAIIAALEGSVASPHVLEYAEVDSVAALGTAVIISYEVPSGKTLWLRSVKVSGNNYAKYTMKIDGVVKERVRTHDGSLEGRFFFESTSTKDGIGVTAGKMVIVEVFNFRPFVGEFECTLFGKLT